VPTSVPTLKTSYLPMDRTRTHVHRCCAVLITASLTLCVAQGAERDNSPKRQAALNKLCQRLEIGNGATVADIGCGRGDDTLTFAEIVDKEGIVLAEAVDKMTEQVRSLGPLSWKQTVLAGNGHEPVEVGVPEAEEV